MPSGSPWPGGPHNEGVVVTEWALDRIALSGLRAVGYHGVFDFERREGQEFVVDVVLDVDTRVAALSDDLSDTVNYADVADAVYAWSTAVSSAYTSLCTSRRLPWRWLSPTSPSRWYANSR